MAHGASLETKNNVIRQYLFFALISILIYIREYFVLTFLYYLDPPQNGSTPLYLSCCFEHEDLSLALVAKGASLDAMSIVSTNLVFTAHNIYINTLTYINLSRQIVKFVLFQTFSYDNTSLFSLPLSIALQFF